MARALVIGVPQTRFGGGRLANLPEVEEDVRQVGNLLVSRGFEVARTGAEEPTVEVVGSRLVEAVRQTRSGELTVIYLSGHGWLTEATNPDEEDDGWDECFVCEDGAIRDNWFRDKLWPLAQPGSRFVVVVDACHSATIFRDIAAEGIPEVTPISRSGTQDYDRLLLSACRDEQVTFADPATGGSIVTAQLLEALEVDPDVDYAHLWPRVRDMVRERYPREKVPEPQAEHLGPDDSLLALRAFTP